MGEWVYGFECIWTMIEGGIRGAGPGLNVMIMVNTLLLLFFSILFSLVILTFFFVFVSFVCILLLSHSATLA